MITRLEQDHLDCAERTRKGNERLARQREKRREKKRLRKADLASKKKTKGVFSSKYNPSAHRSGPVKIFGPNNRPIKATASPKLVLNYSFPDFPAYRAGMTSFEFCRTREWMSARQQTLMRYGPVCQCCGADRASGTIMQVDHIKPRSRFPALELDLENLQVLCRECNIGKGTTEKDWR